jgi:hypothetical protein
MSSASVTPSPPVATDGTTVPRAKKTQPVSTGQKYDLSTASNLPIKATSEGGSKRMMDIVFEKLRYRIDSEWTEGTEVSKILENFEDVQLVTPNRLSDEEDERPATGGNVERGREATHGRTSCASKSKTETLCHSVADPITEPTKQNLRAGGVREKRPGQGPIVASHHGERASYQF